MTRKAIIYVRESTKEQDWESQLLECREYTKKHGLEIVKEYVDQMSGARSDRKGFIELQNDIEQGEFDVLVLWELSRMTRDFVTYRLMFQSLQEACIELHSLQEGILSTDDDIDKNFGTDLLALLGERERKILGRRIKLRMQTIRETGKWGGGKPPYGFDSVEGCLVQNEDAIKVIEMFNLYLRGLTLIDIAKRFGMDKGRQIKRILVNPVYIGKIKFVAEVVNGKRKKLDTPRVIEGLHEAIIDEDTFYLVQRQLKKGRRSSWKESYLLTNVYCQCGCKSYPSFDRNNFLNYTCKENRHWHRGKELEEQVMEALEKQFKDFQLEESDPNNPHTRIKLYETELKKLLAKEKALTKKWLDGNMSDEIYNNFSEELSANRLDVQEEIEYLKNVVSKPKEINTKEIMGKYFEKLKTTDDKKKVKKILDLIIHEVRYANNFRAVVITNLI